MKLKGKSFMTILISITLFICSMVPVSGEERQKKIRVGFYESPYFQTIEKDGSLSGYSYDYLQAISQYTGWDYEFVKTTTFSECLELLKNGEIDIVGVMLKTPEREEIFDFPDLPSGVCMSILVTGKQNRTLAYEDYAAFNGITVGLQKGFVRNEGLQEYCKKKNFSVQTIVYDNQKEMLDAMSRGEVDAALIRSNQNSPEYRAIAKFDTNNVYYATTKGNKKVLDGLNYALEKIKITSPNFDNDLDNKYFDFSSGQMAVLSKEESAYLAKHPTVKVLYDSAWEPYEFTQRDGTPHGIAIDVLEKVSEAVNVNFQYTSVDKQMVKTELFNSGGYDVLSAMTYCYQWADKNDIYITQPYLSVDYLGVYKDIKKTVHRVALPKGFYISEIVQKILPREAVIETYDTVEDCMEAVKDGLADCTYVNTYEAEYYLTIPKYRLLQFRTVQGLSQQLSVGISKKTDPLLYSIISKGLATISQEELREIIRTHLNHPQQSSFFDMMYTNPVHFVSILSIIGFILTAYLIVYVLYKHKNRENEILQMTNKAKSEFLSHVSHDMRTPINAIIGLSSLGMSSEELEKSKGYHENINQTSGYLLRLINDTLDMSVLDNNKMRLHPKPCYFSDFLREIEIIIHERAMEKGIQFQTQMNTDYKQAVLFDELRLQQIFINLINNAIKFTPPGGNVSFIIETMELEDNKIMVVFTIRDTGIGMSAEFQKRMFEPFEQEEDRIPFLESGTGLGLAIVRQLVDLMGGTIQCISQPGGGTEFIVKIETQRWEDVSELHCREKVSQQESFSKGKRILLCEDHPVNAQIVIALLQKRGFIVEHGENGEVGVNLFKNSPIGYYQAILMDVRMPLLNGLEAVAIIRALEREDATKVPIIAMSANAFQEDINLSLEVGMDAHLSKPVDAMELFDTLEEVIKMKSS